MDKNVVAGLACQIAFEYPNWGNEHISDMLATQEGKKPCSSDILYEATSKADTLKRAGKSYEKTLQEVKKFIGIL